MATQQQKGNCYLCGAELGKVAMKNHILKLHSDSTGEQECCLIKVEGMDKRYWLLLDMPLTSSLKNLDDFLRKIWLECCGHMSAFEGSGYREYPMSCKLSAFPEGAQIGYEYDFGDTTRLQVTFVGQTRRKKQREVVRLLARNTPIRWKCAGCGAPAELVDTEDMFGEAPACYCEACAEKAEIDLDMALPVTNSPRMGACAYTGELDHYGFEEYAKRNGK